MGKRGPAPLGDYDNKSAVLSTRIRADTRAALQAAAVASGRSLSQEIETRLRRSLDFDGKVSDAFGDRRFYALMRIVASAMGMIENPTEKSNWLDDPYAYDQAVKAVQAVLEAFRPKGVPALAPELFATSTWWFEQLKAELYSAVTRYQGALTSEQVLTDVAAAPDALPAVAPKNPSDRLPWIKADLADLAARIPRQGGAKEAVDTLVKTMLVEAATNDPRIPEEHKQGALRALGKSAKEPS